VALCALKCDGLLDEPADELRERKVAVKLGIQVRELEEVARRLREVGLINDAMQPLAWDRLQPGRDLSTNRVRAFREKRAQSTLSEHETHETVSTAFQQQNETALDKDKEGDIDKPPLPPLKGERVKGRRLPQDWEPDDDKVPDSLISKIIATIPDGHRGAWLDETLEAFKAYWLSKAGAGAVKLDWNLTWHNWLRKALNDVRPGRFTASQEAPRQYRHNGNGERERRGSYPSDKHGPREIGAALPLALSRRGGPASAGG
jgi:hypothetical protein